MPPAAKPRGKASKLHKLPEPIPEGFAISDTSKKSWTIGQEIGSGGFGTVYFGAETLKPKDLNYVVKVEYHDNGPLFTEMHCYKNIGKPELIADWAKKNKLSYLGLSACHAIGSFEYNKSKYRFMVIERYGTDLQKLLNENGKVFPVKTVYLIGVSILNVLEYIHSAGYVHGDIKAANLLLGRKRGTENQIYLVDLGLACKYTTGGNHKKNAPDPKKAHNGTLEFSSRDSHNGSFARRSDLEILCYNVLQWLTGRLPWEKCKTPQEAQKQKEKYMANPDEFLKMLFPAGDCPDGLPKLLNYVSDLDFEEEPDYHYCRKLLTDGLKKMRRGNDDRLVFNSSPKQAETTSKTPEEKPTSNKENAKKVSTRQAQPKRKTKEEIHVDPNIIPTPAMLEIMNKRTCPDVKKARKKNP